MHLVHMDILGHPLENSSLSQKNSKETVLFTLPNEIIQKILFYLSLEEILPTRLVSKRFAKLVGDNKTWGIYYKTLGLVPPLVPQNLNGELSLSPLAKTLPLWISIQKTIEEATLDLKKGEGSQIYSRSLCIVALSFPELSPLHFYATETLKKLCKAPKELTVDDLYLSIARGEQNFIVQEQARLLVIEQLSESITEPVQEVLLSILEKKDALSILEEKWAMVFDSMDDPVFKAEPRNVIAPLPFTLHKPKNFYHTIVKGLLPFLTSPEGQNALLTGIRKYGTFTMLSVLNRLSMNPKVLDAIIDSFKKNIGLYKITRKHLNNPFVVDQLRQRLTSTKSLGLKNELARALEPVANQIPVQRTLCQRLFSDIQRNECFSTQLIFVITNAKLSEEIIREFRDFIPMIKEIATANKISELSPLTDLEHRKFLIDSLYSENSFERVIAVKLLTPLLPDNPEILDKFLGLINFRGFKKIGVAVVSALATLAHRKDIRTILIERGYLDGRRHNFELDYPHIRLATIDALRPFVNEPEVRRAFLSRFENDEDIRIRCALIDVLAPQIKEQDVRNLFFKAVENKLPVSPYLSGRSFQIAAIEKLKLDINLPDVQKLLLNQFEASTDAYEEHVQAACIKALSFNKDKCLIGVSRLFKLCLHNSVQVSKEAREALKLWTNLETQ